MKFIAIIPARYASTRFPAKPLAWLAGKPIVQHVYERVSQVIADTFVATDDERIFAAVEKFGGKAIMTSTEHRSGTDRCYEAARKLNMEYDVVINVQGDEPFIAASQLHALMDCFEHRRTQIATLVKPFALHQGWEALSNPNSPKVVIDEQGFLSLCDTFPARYSRDRMVGTPYFLQAHRHLCLSKGSTAHHPSFASKPFGDCRKLGATALAGSRIENSCGANGDRDNWY